MLLPGARAAPGGPGRGSRVADFARSRWSRGAGRQPPETLPTLYESGQNIFVQSESTLSIETAGGLSSEYALSESLRPEMTRGRHTHQTKLGWVRLPFRQLLGPATRVGPLCSRTGQPIFEARPDQNPDLVLPAARPTRRVVGRPAQPAQPATLAGVRS